MQLSLPTISIIQPWAGFIMLGCKEVDDRWFRLAGLLRHDVRHRPEFTCGAVLGIVDLVDCRVAGPRCPTAWHDANPDPEFRNQYWWELADPVPLRQPIRQSGKLRVWPYKIHDDLLCHHPTWTTIRQYVDAHSPTLPNQGTPTR